MSAARSHLGASYAVGLLGSTSTTVYLIVAGLIALGLAMIATTIWLVRATRRDHVVLGPLERMGERRWRRQQEPERVRELDSARRGTGSQIDEPDDAEPMAVGELDVIDPEPAPEPDAAAGEVGDEPEPTPEEVTAVDNGSQPRGEVEAEPPPDDAADHVDTRAHEGDPA